MNGIRGNVSVSILKFDCDDNEVMDVVEVLPDKPFRDVWVHIV